eukprot:snap_masked-scaffold_14-processed-gene-0.30-mRNA-1 protein AED:1.00 eAED:1.00 QI:0/0/0/0/1/1/2/0/81
MMNRGFQQLQRLLQTIQTSSVNSERAFSHGRFKHKGKENMSDQTFMMRMNAREWMKLQKSYGISFFGFLNLLAQVFSLFSY